MRRSGAKAGSQRESPRLLVVASWLLLMSFRPRPWDPSGGSFPVTKPKSLPQTPMSSASQPTTGHLEDHPCDTLSSLSLSALSCLPPLRLPLLGPSSCLLFIGAILSALHAVPLSSPVSTLTPSPGLLPRPTRGHHCQPSLDVSITAQLSNGLCLLTPAPTPTPECPFLQPPHPTTHLSSVPIITSKQPGFQGSCSVLTEALPSPRPAAPLQECWQTTTLAIQ